MAEPLAKRIKTEPEPPSRIPEGQAEGEGGAVVADRVQPDDGLQGVRSAFRKKLQRIDFKVKEKSTDLKACLESFQPNFLRQIQTYLTEHRGLKVYLVLTISYLSQEIPEQKP